ncbi:NADAR family protein [Sphingobacterium siyangense]|uniref:NADAR family protein n=1 Tax=Sphingobacterium siyangense TaxID=459529 RepID=UPI003DA26E42
MVQYTIKWLTDRFENGDSFKFLFFWGHTAKQNQEVGKFVFSQWYESPFTVDNITYRTAEHWMMAQKALLFDDKKNFEKIINCAYSAPYYTTIPLQSTPVIPLQNTPLWCKFLAA